MERPISQYVISWPLGIRLFWYQDELGVWQCRADVFRETKEICATGKVERDGEVVELRGNEMTTEERLRRVIVDAFYWLKDADTSRDSRLTKDQISIAKTALTALGLALGLPAKTKEQSNEGK